MRTRPWATAGIALVASIALATAGCGNSGNDDNGGGDAPADPKQALTASVQGIADGNFTFTLADHESAGHGSLHAESKSAEITAETAPGTPEDESFEFAFVIVDKDRWMKMSFGDPTVAELLKLPKGWQHIDPTKITDEDTKKDLAVEFGNAEKSDPAGAAIIISKGLVTAEESGEGAYTGTVDLTKAKDAGMVNGEVLSALGTKASSLPFTAKLDGEGRLTEFIVDVPAAGKFKAHKLKATYEYGVAKAAKKPPAGQTKEAPAATYELLNS